MQMATSIEADNGEMIVKRVSVPIGLEELMEGLTKEVILKKPKDIYVFASEYFANLLNLREKGSLKATPGRRVQSVTKHISSDNIVKQLKTKSKSVEPVKQLTRQQSIRSDSPAKKTLTTTKIVLSSKKDKNEKSEKAKNFLDKRKARKGSKDETLKKTPSVQSDQREKRTPRSTDKSGIKNKVDVMKTPRKGSQGETKQAVNSTKIDEKPIQEKNDGAINSESKTVLTQSITGSATGNLHGEETENNINTERESKAIDDNAVSVSEDKKSIQGETNEAKMTTSNLSNSESEGSAMKNTEALDIIGKDISATPTDVERISSNDIETNKTECEMDENKNEDTNENVSLDEVDFQKSIDTTNLDSVTKSDKLDTDESSTQGKALNNLSEDSAAMVSSNLSMSNKKEEEEDSDEHKNEISNPTTATIPDLNEDKQSDMNSLSKDSVEIVPSNLSMSDNKEDSGESKDNTSHSTTSNIPDINDEKQSDKISVDNVDTISETSIIQDVDKVEETGTEVEHNNTENLNLVDLKNSGQGEINDSSQDSNSHTKAEKENDDNTTMITPLTSEEVTQYTDDTVSKEETESNKKEITSDPQSTAALKENVETDQENKENVAANNDSNKKLNSNSLSKTHATNHLPNGALKTNKSEEATKKSKVNVKIKNTKTKSLSQELLKLKDFDKEKDAKKMKRVKSVDSHKKDITKVKSNTKFDSVDQDDKLEDNSRNDKDNKKRSKRSASVTKESKNLGKMQQNSFDSSKLRQEIKEVNELNKATNFKPSYNPYKLRQEIKQASVDGTHQETNTMSKVASEVAAAIKIQSIWRGFSYRKYNQAKQSITTDATKVKDIAKTTLEVKQVEAVGKQNQNLVSQSNSDYVDGMTTQKNKEINDANSVSENKLNATEEDSEEKIEQEESKKDQDSLTSEARDVEMKSKNETTEKIESVEIKESRNVGKISDGKQKHNENEKTSDAAIADVKVTSDNKNEEKPVSTSFDNKQLEKNEERYLTKNDNKDLTTTTEVPLTSNIELDHSDKETKENSILESQTVTYDQKSNEIIQENLQLNGHLEHLEEEESDNVDLETKQETKEGKILSKEMKQAELSENKNKDSAATRDSETKTETTETDKIISTDTQELSNKSSSEPTMTESKQPESEPGPGVFAKSSRDEHTEDKNKKTKDERDVLENNNTHDSAEEVKEGITKTILSNVSQEVSGKLSEPQNNLQKDSNEKEESEHNLDENKKNDKAEKQDENASKVKLDMAEAVVRIQAIWRGFKIRKHLKHEKLFGAEVKEEIEHNEPLELVSKNKEDAVSRIQALWRGYKVRKNVKDVNKRLAELQTPTECDEMPSQRQLSDEDIFNAATKIQAAIRGYMVRKNKSNVGGLKSITEETSPQLSDEQVSDSLRQLREIPNNSPELGNKSQIEQKTEQTHVLNSLPNASEKIIDDQKGTGNELTKNNVTMGAKEDNEKTENEVKFTASELHSSTPNKLSNLETTGVIGDSISNSPINKADVDSISSTTYNETGYADAPTRPVTSHVAEDLINAGIDPQKQNIDDNHINVESHENKNEELSESHPEELNQTQQLSRQESSVSADSIATVIFNDTEIQPEIVSQDECDEKSLADGRKKTFVEAEHNPEIVQSNKLESENGIDNQTTEVAENQTKTLKTDSFENSDPKKMKGDINDQDQDSEVQNMKNVIEEGIVKENVKQNETLPPGNNIKNKMEKPSSESNNEEENRTKDHKKMTSEINDQDQNSEEQNMKNIVEEDVKENVIQNETLPSNNNVKNKIERPSSESNDEEKDKTTSAEDAKIYEATKKHEQEDERTKLKKPITNLDKSCESDKFDNSTILGEKESADNTRGNVNHLLVENSNNKLNIPALEKEIERANEQLQNMDSKNCSVVDMNVSTQSTDDFKTSIDGSQIHIEDKNNKLNMAALEDEIKNSNQELQTMVARNTEQSSENLNLQENQKTVELDTTNDTKTETPVPTSSENECEKETHDENKSTPSLDKGRENVSTELREESESPSEKDSLRVHVPMSELSEIKEEEVDAKSSTESVEDLEDETKLSKNNSLVDSNQNIPDETTKNKPKSSKVETPDISETEKSEHNDVVERKTPESEPKIEKTFEENKTESQPNDQKKIRQQSAGTTINLIHSGEFHDTITLPISVTPPARTSPREGENQAKSRQASPQGLVHTGELHDNVLPISVQLDEAPPAGAEVLTSHVSESIITDGRDRAQASNKDASTCEAEPEPDNTSSTASMETEKRNNATSKPKKSMEAEAATKIQAGFRGYQVRKQLKNKISSPGDISNLRRSARRKSSGRVTESGRIIQNKPKSPSALEEKSAVKIQAGVRGFLVRRRQKKQKQGKNSS